MQKKKKKPQTKTEIGSCELSVPVFCLIAPHCSLMLTLHHSVTFPFHFTSFCSEILWKWQLQMWLIKHSAAWRLNPSFTGGGSLGFKTTTDEPARSEREHVYTLQEQGVDEAWGGGGSLGAVSASRESMFHIKDTSSFISFYLEDGEKFSLRGPQVKITITCHNSFYGRLLIACTSACVSMSRVLRDEPYQVVCDGSLSTPVTSRFEDVSDSRLFFRLISKGNDWF